MTEVVRIDMDSWYRTGWTISGIEYFFGSMRLRCAKSMPCLPSGCSEQPDNFAPLFPELNHVLDVTDGCASQFVSKINFFRTAKAGSERDHCVKRELFRREVSHGKCICDGISNKPKKDLERLATTGAAVPEDVRGIVVQLANEATGRSTQNSRQRNPYRIGKYFYGYVNVRNLTKVLVPDSDGFSGSSKAHFLRGCGVGGSHGRLSVRELPCACTDCRAKDPNRCRHKRLITKERMVFVKPKTSAAQQDLRQIRRDKFSSFCEAFDSNTSNFVGVKGLSDDGTSEMWIARVRGDVMTLEKDELNATEELKAGYRVIEAHWCEFWGTRKEGDLYYLSRRDNRGWHKLNMGLILRVTGIKMKKQPKNLYLLTKLDQSRLNRAFEEG
ncbi:MAG: hypothetical protein AAGM67_00425 [Bacteroidota bacterium]